MRRLLATSLAVIPPALWGSTYLVTTELLPPDKPLLAATLRILPVGILIILFTRYLPTRDQWAKLIVVSVLCMSLFHWALFLSAYQLPGGLAALLVSSQPLMVVILAYIMFGAHATLRTGVGILVGIVGVFMLLIVPSKLEWNTVGIIAALVAATSMSLGTILTKRWQFDMPVLAFTGWQLLIGGLILLPFAVSLELPLQAFEVEHLGGFVYLALLGTLFPYLIWFSALRHLEPVVISTLLLLSPLSAMLLGYVVLGQALTSLQIAGALAVLAGVLVSNLPSSAFSLRKS